MVIVDAMSFLHQGCDNLHPIAEEYADTLGGLFLPGAIHADSGREGDGKWVIRRVTRRVVFVFALISRSDAVNAEAKAKSQAYAADSSNQLAIDPELSVLLGIRGVRAQTTPQAMFALRAALDASPIRARLPTVGHGNCLVPGERAAAAPTNAPTVAFSPDGRQLAEGLCLERQIRIANPLTGRIEHVIRLGGPGEWFTYADQRTLVADPRGRLERLDADTGQVISQGPAADAQAPLALDPRPRSSPLRRTRTSCCGTCAPGRSAGCP